MSRRTVLRVRRPARIRPTRRRPRHPQAPVPQRASPRWGPPESRDCAERRPRDWRSAASRHHLPALPSRTRPDWTAALGRRHDPTRGATRRLTPQRRAAGLCSIPAPQSSASTGQWQLRRGGPRRHHQPPRRPPPRPQRHTGRRAALGMARSWQLLGCGHQVGPLSRRSVCRCCVQPGRGLSAWPAYRLAGASANPTPGGQPARLDPARIASRGGFAGCSPASAGA